MAKIRIKQIKSSIGSNKRQKATLAALGLKKLHNAVEHVENEQINGMVRKVLHLVTVEKVK